LFSRHCHPERSVAKSRDLRFVRSGKDPGAPSSSPSFGDRVEGMSSRAKLRIRDSPAEEKADQLELQN
jgi:hypothetical protein